MGGRNGCGSPDQAARHHRHDPRVDPNRRGAQESRAGWAARNQRDPEGGWRSGRATALDYPAHLWREKEIKSVANVTRQDVREFLELAAEIPIKPEVQEYALEDANEALVALKSSSVRGAKVLRVT